jgi:hypothetical protein
MESETRVLDPSGKLVNPIDALRRFAGVDAVGVDTEDGELVFLRGEEEVFRADALLLATHDGGDLAPCLAEEIYGVSLPIADLPKELREPTAWSEGLIAMLQHAFRSGYAHDTLILEQGLEHLVVHGPLRMLSPAVRKRVPALARTAYVLDTTFTLLRALFMLSAGKVKSGAVARVAGSVRVLRALATDEDADALEALATKLDEWAKRPESETEPDVELTALGLEEALRWKKRLAAHDARRAELPGAADDSLSRDAPPPLIAAPSDESGAPAVKSLERSITFILVMLALVVALGVASLVWIGSLSPAR